uniref:Uncharacterized protein n=1 Tax=Oryza glumipatula TaxID=40148 RepID=A0A0D9YWV8_9ORYZ
MWAPRCHVSKTRQKYCQGTFGEWLDQLKATISYTGRERAEEGGKAVSRVEPWYTKPADVRETKARTDGVSDELASRAVPPHSPGSVARDGIRRPVSP